MNKIIRLAICASVATTLLTGCPSTVPNDPYPATSFNECIPLKLIADNQIVFLGPVTYAVGDVWKKNNTGSPPFDPQYPYSQISNDAATKPDPSLIERGISAQCSVSNNSGGNVSVSLDANAKITAAIPISASAAAALKNSKVTKVSFDSIAVDEIKFIPQYAALIKSIPLPAEEKQSILSGGYYYAYAMIRVTNYTVEITYSGDDELNLGAQATLPAALSGGLKAAVNVSKTSSGTLQFKIPGEVYIAAALRPFGPGAVPQSAGGDADGQPFGTIKYSAPPAGRSNS